MLEIEVRDAETGEQIRTGEIALFRPYPGSPIPVPITEKIALSDVGFKDVTSGVFVARGYHPRHKSLTLDKPNRIEMRPFKDDGGSIMIEGGWGEHQLAPIPSARFVVMQHGEEADDIWFGYLSAAVEDDEEIEGASKRKLTKIGATIPVRDVEGGRWEMVVVEMVEHIALVEYRRLSHGDDSSLESKSKDAAGADTFESPEITPPAGDLEFKGYAPEVSQTQKVTLGHSVHLRRAEILQKAPVVKGSIAHILAHYEISRPNDAETQAFVVNLRALSKSVDEFVLAVKSSPTEREAGEASLSVFSRLIAAIEALESTRIGNNILRLSTASALVGVVVLAAPTLTPVVSFPILSACVFPEEAGKVVKILKSIAKLIPTGSN